MSYDVTAIKIHQ